MASEISVLGESDAALPSGRGMAILLRRADDGDKACLAALAAAGEALGCAIANLITLFAPPKVIITGRAMASSEHFIRPLRETVASASAAEPRGRRGPRGARMGRQHLGARRGGHDVARTLWRAVGHDRARAASRAIEIRGTRHGPVRVGVIGCGNISAAYLKAAKTFPILDMSRSPTLNFAAAEARSAEFGIPAQPVEAVLADPAIEIVLNLTVPKAHVEVGLKAVAAGKHVHSEKPLGVTLAEARRLVEAAAARGLRLGSAPDTFLGGAHQTARQCVDDGLIGRPVGGTAFFMCPGHERWHPNPGFYYLAGGGPMLDMGPYYITDLVNLLGPVASVSGVATRTRDERIVTSEPFAGARVPVEVATHVTGSLHFVSGAAVSMTMSFDVARHRHAPIELYGEKGSLIVPDPNYFGGKVEIATAAEDWREIPVERALCRRQLSHPWACGHGAGDPPRPAAPRERRARLPCARSHGGVSDFVGRAAKPRGYRPGRRGPAPLRAHAPVGELD